MAAIDWTKVSFELRTALEKRLPTGKQLEDIRVVSARVARFEAVAEKEATEFATALEKAGGPKAITNGKPTIMRVVAWMAHEGINKNRLAFVKEDLEQAAAKIKEPDFLPMDFNHSAVDSWYGEQKAIGVWYRAEMAQDPEADNAWGILATGMMWSWLNPDLADRLLAEQARNGRIDFSMACICGSVTKKYDEEGAFEEAGDTTFFTLSALDVPPADPNAKGFGEEGSEDPNLESELRQRLLAKAAMQLSNLRLARSQEGKMEELLATLKTLSEQAAKIADANLKEAVVAAIDAKFAEITAGMKKVAELEGSVADLTAKLEAANAEIASTKATLAEAEAKAASVDDKNVAIEAAKTELANATAEVARLTTELETANGEVAKVREAEVKKAAEEKAVARYAELPASYREAFEKRSAEEQEKARERWAAMSDEAWKSFLDDIAVVPAKISYLARSAAEKAIPSATPSDAGKSRLSKFKDR